jgi:flavin-dependent dehydrogenase
MNPSYDVVICGAGLAGLCMARQLYLSKPSLKVALIDAHDSNIPKAAWKVGESSVEFGAHYLREHLQLADYLARSHLPKRGLRFFLGDAQGQIKDRHEFGSAAPSPFLTYQLDRGILEQDLRNLAKDHGVSFLENCTVTAIEIQAGKAPNTVFYKAKETAAGALECKWVIDASGRRRLLQTKFGLSLPSKAGSCSSAWFRMPGNIKVDDLVQQDEQEWHARVPENKRYLSTNHFVGKGYWVWFIPLSGDATSIGIVTRDEIHPFNTYNTFPKALAWLRHNEPRLAEFIEGKEPIDFKVMRQYSYTSKKIFSADGWACVGEAAVFSDPFYSPGLDFIGMTNTFAAHMIDQDLRNLLEPSQVDVYSRYVVLLNEQITRFIQHAYDYFTDELVTATRVMWDVSAAWGYSLTTS